MESLLRFTLALASSLVLAATAHAQLFRSYLAPSGSDSNPCTLAQPCRLLPAALNAVAAGGEIWILDSANYNTTMVVIDKAVSILAVPGVVGSFVAVNDGVNNRAITITGSGTNVRMRNVAVVNNATSTSAALNGIVVNLGATLVLEDSVVAVPNAGLTVVIANATVRRSVFRDSNIGVRVTEDGTATILDSAFLYDTTGVDVDNFAGFTRSAVVISDSSFGNCGTGVTVSPSGNGDKAVASIMRSTFSLNTTGIQTIGGDATASVGESHFSSNGTALHAFPGSVLESLGNNQGRGNTTLSTGTIAGVAAF